MSESDSSTSRFPSDGTSGIPDELRDTGEGYSRFFPPAFTVPMHEQTRCRFLMDQGGFIPTEDEFWTIVDILARAYRFHDEEWVRDHNQATHERLTKPEPPTPRPKPERKPKPGYVYVLEGQGTFKIGHAKDPTKRGEVLATQLPYPVEVICAIWSEDCKVLEAELHERYATKRLNGEWFDLSTEDVAYIRGLGE